jgi:hypothetical protein
MIIPRLRYQKLLTVIFILCVMSGCSPRKTDEISWQEPEKRLETILKQEMDLDAVLIRYPHTLWIYVPLEEPIFILTANDQAPKQATVLKKIQTINYLENEFRDGRFNIEFDVSIARQYEKSYGYANKYSEAYTAAYLKISRAIPQAYFKTKDDTLPGDSDFTDGKKDPSRRAVIRHRPENTGMPDFFVTIFADIKTGIQTRSIINARDLQRAQYDQGFSEEYQRRVISEEPSGNQGLIGNRTGEFLPTYDLTWPEFLSRQLVHRVKFKYRNSSFPPSFETEKEILHQAYLMSVSYGFDDYTGVALRNLQDGTLTEIPKESLPDYKDAPLPPGGKLHAISFTRP